MSGVKVGDRVRVRHNMLDGDCCFSGLSGEVVWLSCLGLAIVALESDPEGACLSKDDHGRPLAYMSVGFLVPK